MADIFVSYTSADRDWAFWIGHELLNLKHTAHLHDWEIPAGGNIAAWMERTLDNADFILCVVSDSYLKADYSSWERQAAQWAAASNRPNFALPVLIEDCKVPAMLAHFKRCELYGLIQDDARTALAAYLAPAEKPADQPLFPGRAKAPSAPPVPPAAFPGNRTDSSNSTPDLPAPAIFGPQKLEGTEAAHFPVPPFPPNPSAVSPGPRPSPQALSQTPSDSSALNQDGSHRASASPTNAKQPIAKQVKRKGAEPPEAGQEIRVPSGEREVPIGTVSAAETWSFSAAGEWSTGFVSCGPDGYRNFLFDALKFTPRVPGEARLKLVCRFRDEPDWAAFPIGAGCAKTFARSGELVVFANDRPDGYADNRGAVTLTAVRGGVAPGPAHTVGGLSGWWRDVVEVFHRTAGVPVIAAFALGVSGILLFMPQGRDLVRGVGEDGIGPLAIAFAIGVLFFAIQVWSWSRIVIASNYGTKRARWRPRWLLESGPRVLAFLPFAAAAIALTVSFEWNAPVAWILLAIGALLLALLVARKPLTNRMVGDIGTAPWLQGAWVIGGLAMALGAMVVAVLWPAAIGAGLGAPAIVFFGLGFIIPVITIACQLGTSLRIPVVGALLLWAVLIGAFFDNHQVGRRALVAETGGSTERPTLERAFKQWADHQPVDPNGKKTMVLVAVQGGASRAGYWTAVALSSLREAAKAKAVDIDSHIFALSSVSGGSVGSVGYAAMLKTARDDKNFRNDLLGFAGRDALGPALTGMLYSDLLYRFLPLWLLPDRAETLERSWEEAWDAPDDNGAFDPRSRTAGTISGPFLALAPKAGEPWRPLLIVQGASESGGRRMLTSAVRFTCDEVDADDLLDGIDHDVAASTAILNGARFPWVSPGGTFAYRPCYAKEGDPRSSDHVLDGGYFDNAGAETLREMTRAIRALPGGGEKDLDIVFVLIGYADHDPAGPPPLPPTGLKAWVSDRIASLVPNDVFAPLLGLYNGMDAHEAHLAREMKLSSQAVVVDPDPYVSRLTGDDPYAALVLCPGEVKLSDGRTISYDPPMDWTLSGEAKRYIENSVIATTPACNAKANVEAIGAIVDKLKR